MKLICITLIDNSMLHLEDIGDVYYEKDYLTLAIEYANSITYIPMCNIKSFNIMD